MNEMYNRIEELCASEGINITEMCRRAKIPRGNLTDLKYGRTSALSTKSLYKISKLFRVPIDYFLLDFVHGSKCPDCGMLFVGSDIEEVRNHKKYHDKWAKAVEKFGFCWPHDVREWHKVLAFDAMAESNITVTKHSDAVLETFKAYFSRSLEATEFNLNHVDFPKYVAMLLNQQKWVDELSEEVYTELVKRFGKLDGLPSGTYYTIDQNSIKEDESDILLLQKYRRLTDNGRATVDKVIDGLLEAGHPEPGKEP